MENLTYEQRIENLKKWKKEYFKFKAEANARIANYDSFFMSEFSGPHEVRTVLGNLPDYDMFLKDLAYVTSYDRYLEKIDNKIAELERLRTNS